MNKAQKRVLAIQNALRERGFLGTNKKPLVLDGVQGINTSSAIINFKRSVGLPATDFVGPVTYAKLTGDGTAVTDKIPSKNVPWFDEALKMIGTHERLDHSELSAWLRSDGSTVGDPALVPYCGDGVETALKLAIPDIIVPGNPYLAANWATWGDFVVPQRGAIMSFWRGSPDSWQGHVGFYAGESDENYYILGFNQNDSVNITPIAKNRLRKNGSRWPAEKYGFKPRGQVVRMSGGTVSTNEA